MKFILLLCLLFTSFVFGQQQQCQGVEILYPKADSVIDQTKESTNYLILGNTYNSILKKVIVLQEGGGEQEIWTGKDELLKVTVIQQDVTQVTNSYWFRVLIEQDNHECYVDSSVIKSL